MNIRKLLVLIVAVALTGCASQQIQRDSARVLAAKAIEVQHDLEAFSIARQNADIARQRTANRLLRSALETEALNTAQLAMWRVAEDKARLSIADELMRAVDAAVKQSHAADESIARAIALADGTKSRVATRSDQLGATAKVLGQLAEKEPLRDRIAFQVHFVDEVHESINEASKAAEKAAKGAAGAVNQSVLDAQKGTKK